MAFSVDGMAAPEIRLVTGMLEHYHSIQENGRRAMKIVRPEELTPEIIASLRFDELSAGELKEAYALARAAFTAEDLQRYTELDEGIPEEEVLSELEEAQKQIDAQRSA
jgi:hypothetical protein